MSRNQQLNSNFPNFDIHPATFAMTQQISVAMLEHCQTVWAQQLDSLDDLTTETARQCRQALQSAADNGARPNRWSEQFYPRRQKFVEIARGWLDMSSQATAEINQLWDQALTASLKLGEPKLATNPHRERRIGAMVISFADRRRSAHQSKVGSAHSAPGQTSASMSASPKRRNST